MPTMKAIRIHTYGGPEVLRYEDVPRPVPAAGEVLIKIHAAAVNPVDWKVRAGLVRELLKHQLPLIPGWDAAGVIEDVGAGVARLKRGDEVYTRPDIFRDGTYAEYIAVREPEVALKPKSLDHVHAAAIPLAALTAWQALFDAGGVSAGQRVLIHAAAGGVGSFAVQLAKCKGAYVIGTASANNREFLRGLGADEVIDYNAVRFEDHVHDVDMVLDAMAGETQRRSWKTLKPGGILVSILGGVENPPAGARHAQVFVQPDAAQLSEIAKLVDAGKVRAIVETVLPLTEARHAQELNETGHTRGKIVLRVI
jgi:NADPH:quinone reductase-like Zn-dependent oxidoreductase